MSILTPPTIADTVTMTVFQSISSSTSPYSTTRRFSPRVKKLESILENPHLFVYENSKEAVAAADKAANSNQPIVASLEEVDVDEPFVARDLAYGVEVEEKEPLGEAEQAIRSQKPLTAVEQAIIDATHRAQTDLPEAERHLSKFPIRLAEDISMADMCSTIGEAVHAEFKAQLIPLTIPTRGTGLFSEGFEVLESQAIKAEYEFEGKTFEPKWGELEVRIAVGAELLALAKEAFTLDKYVLLFRFVCLFMFNPG